MANSGYFLQGLGRGLQTGLNMGQQLQEMRWQKKQRKELEVKQAKMIEVSNIWNAKIKEAGADNIYSDEEIAQLSTIVLSGGYEFMEHYKGALDAIKSMNKSKYDQEKEWMDLFASGVEGLPSGDIQAMYEYIKPRITSEKGLNILEAYNNILQKRAKVAQDQPQPEVFTSPEAVLAKYPDSGYTYSANAGGYVPTFQKPTKEEAPPTELDIMGETQKKLDAAYATGNANYFNQMAKSLNVPTTFETYKQKYEKPEAAGGVKEEEPILRTDIAYWEKTFSNIKSEEEYNRQYDLLKQSKTSKQYEPKPYKEMITNEVKAMAKEIKALLTFDSKFKSDEAKATYAKYQAIYEQKVRELIAKYPDTDISQFPKYLPVDQIKKVGFWKGAFTLGGVAKGDYSVIDTKGW